MPKPPFLEEDEADAGNTTGKGDPFKPVKEWGSKNRKQESKQKRKSNKQAAIKDQVANSSLSLALNLSWGTFSESALPDTLTSEPEEHDAAIDHSKDGEARDTSCGFVAAMRLTAQKGSADPISTLPPAPPGAAQRAKDKRASGEKVDPATNLDKFNWDSLPLPGTGQINNN